MGVVNIISNKRNGKEFNYKLPYGGSFSDISYAINDHINQYRWEREQYNESNEYLINHII